MLIMKHKKDLISESEKKARGMVGRQRQQYPILYAYYLPIIYKDKD